MYELNNKAVELSKKGHLEEAIELFNQELAQRPNDPNLNFNIALVYMKKDDFTVAIKYLLKSIEAEKNDDNLRELAVCYIRLKEFDNAKKYLDEALMSFDSSDTHNVLGVLNFQLENFQEAKDEFEKATKLKPKNADAWFNLSDTYSELGMEREAKMARYKFDQLEKE